MRNHRVGNGPHRWCYRVGAAPTWRFLGAVAGIAFVVPFILATALERSLGDAGTITVLAVLVAAALGTVSVLFRRGRRVEAALVAPVLPGLGIAIWITATMQWR